MKRTKAAVMTVFVGIMLTFILIGCDTGNGTPEGNDDYDREFTIYVNGRDDWTPYAGASGVTFSNSDNGVLTISDNGTKVEFTGIQVGNSIITATHSGNEKRAL